MKFEIEEKIVKPVIEAHIASAIVDQIGDAEELVRAMVRLALNKKVDSDGKVNSYGSYNTHNFVEVLAGNAIRNAAQKAVVKVVEEQQPLIQRAVEDELRTHPENTAAAIVNAFTKGVKNQYRFKADFTISED